jgi:drug/metabolite transporter (DMT)-like permease
MSQEVALAVLAAALLHANWHALVKSSGDQVVALAGMNLVSGTTALLFLPFVTAPSAEAFAVIATSVVLHGGYKVALARLYRGTALSVAYPLARGITPVIATIFGAVLLEQSPGQGAQLGTLLVSVGVCALIFDRSGAPIAVAALVSACWVGLAVASYSALDAYGIRITGDWLGFTAWLIVCDSAAFIAYAIATRGRKAFALWRQKYGQTLISGFLGTASFGVFMWALGRAPVGPVSALRETTIIFAALIGMVFLRERVTLLRIAAAVIVLLGAATIALSR